MAEQIMRLEAQVAQHDAQLAELDQAISAGRAARGIAEQIFKHLDTAAGYGTWDMLGGGLLVDLAKHDELDAAQTLVERLQVQLGRFKTELADVAINDELHVKIEGFMRFADYFFDGLFADWAVMDQIDTAKGQVRETQRQIDTLLEKLAEDRGKKLQTRNAVEAQRNMLVDEA